MNLRAAIAIPALSVTLVLAACGVESAETTTDQRAADTDACANLASGPFTPERVGQPFNGSEDFTFDGQGHMVGKKGNVVVRVGTADADSTNLASLPGQTYGVRFHPNGNLIAAIPGAGKLVTITPTGQVTDLLTGLRGPNGVYVDFGGTIWWTEFNGSKVSRLAPDGTVTLMASGSATAQAADGIVLDASKNLLFYTEYQKGKIQRMPANSPGAAPEVVATIPGAALDGMVLDACGNVYAVDNGNNRVYRVRVDAHGAATAAPELLVTLPTNVAAANFGSGPGFDPKKLYITGNPGTVYAIPVGVTGALHDGGSS